MICTATFGIPIGNCTISRDEMHCLSLWRLVRQDPHYPYVTQLSHFPLCHPAFTFPVSTVL
jgi:hypothetical protein